jgi:hypothetical protein
MAALAGLMAGLGQLVRLDALTVAPSVLLVLATLPAPRRTRVAAAVAFTVVAAAAFAPWPLRNLQRFGSPHLAAATWRDMSGEAMPDGPLVWARSWSTAAPGTTWFDYNFAHRQSLRVDAIVPSMSDGAAEHVRTLAIVEQYNREGLTPEVDAAFRALGEARARRHPVRVWLLLPVARFARMFVPLSDDELPMRVSFLGLPEHRGAFATCDYLLYGLAALGAVVLARRRRWLVVAALGLPVLGRAMNALCMPLSGTQRFLAPVVPCLIVLGLMGGWWLGGLAATVRRRLLRLPRPQAE